jgi:membrane protein implicated in regulation of membrane protease activity
MASLADKDRDALLLRFFKNESLASLGGTMGISEDAAQKRVSRALGKLREFLAQRGITTSEAALSATLAANAIETAPGGAAAVWISGALAGAPLSSSSVLTLLNMKTAFLIAALAGRFLVLTVLHVRSLRRVDKLQAALQAQAKDIAALRAEIEQLNARPTVTEEDARTREIARLRAKIDRLRTDLDAEKARKTISTPQSEMRGPSAVADAIPPQVVIQSAFLTAPTAAFSGAATGLMTADQAASMVTALTNHPDVNLIFLPRVTTLCGRQAHVAATDSVPIGSGSTNIGLSLDVLPECSTNSGLVSLQFFLVGTHLTAQSEIEQITTNASIAVPDGNALVLTMGIPGDGPWFAGDPTNSEGSRALIMVLTPTLIDPAGNRLHPADTNDSPQTVTANPSGVFSAPGPLPSP